MQTLDDFTLAYIECALWSSNDESTPEGGVPLDSNYGIHDLHPDALAAITDDCRKFQKEHAADISGDLSAAGHDFWLTRNGHGAGFWDGDWPKDAGDRLTAASEKLGEVYLYVGDDGKLYV